MKKNPSSFLENLNEIVGNIRSPLISNDYNEFGSKSSTPFISIASPSMTGKTQSVFAVSSKVPLYFVNSESQDIYRPFNSLSNSLFSLVNNDYSNLIQLWSNNKDHYVRRSWDNSFITFSDFLHAQHSPMSSLGLIYALFEEAEKFHTETNGQSEDRLDYFSRTRDVSYSPMSISEFVSRPLYETFKTKYFIFLDEFSTDKDLVTLRNLLRSLEFTCVLSSTNSRIINLIGASARTGSRDTEAGPWSVVFHSLSPMTLSYLNSNPEYQKVLESLTKRASELSTSENEKMRRLVEYLKAQFLVSRPGFAHMILEKIMSYQLNEMSADLIFEKLIIDQRARLGQRKSVAFHTIIGSRAKARLMTGNHFYNGLRRIDNSGNAHFETLMIDKH